MSDGRLITYQHSGWSPATAWALQRFSPTRNQRSRIRRRIIHRHTDELHELFELFGAGDRLHHTQSRADLERGRFVVPLSLVAYYFLSPDFPKNRLGYSIYEALSSHERRALGDLDGRLLLGLVTEAFFASEEYVEKFHLELERWDIDPAQVVVLNNNLRSEEAYQLACASLGYSRRALILPFPGNYWLLVGRESRRSDAAVSARADAAYSTLRSGRGRSFKFLSFNGKVRPHRLYVVLYLLSRGLLDEGKVSLLAFNPGERDSSDDLLSMLDQFPANEDLRSYVPELMARMPLILDLAPGRAPASSMFVSQDPSLYDDSYFSIVTDTLFADESMLYLTEKPFKAILNLHPFVYLGSRESLAELRQMGYETFAPWIDETYDTVADPSTRMTLVLHEIDRLARLSHDELHEMYCKLWPRLKHNYDLLTREASVRYLEEAQAKIWSRCGLSVFN
ncbi:MAG TPA: hypothetical protein VMM60_16740 [Ilumatobacter sp.]|nr:hypothetical protein [Ilumatobacter sp.]